jgi:hypothetical protein
MPNIVVEQEGLTERRHSNSWFIVVITLEAYLNGVAFQITMHTMPLIDYGAANELCSVISVPTKTCSRHQTINFGSPYPYAFVEHVTFKPILVL